MEVTVRAPKARKVKTAFEPHTGSTVKKLKKPKPSVVKKA
jgi:hypothetical protein